jgi:hypothetical protein
MNLPLDGRAATCPLCGATLSEAQNCQALYDELSLYTIARGREEFIHQHAVDAYAAQHVTESTKPIALAAALIGLYLFAEKNYSGLRVQQVHMQLGNRMKQWPLFPAPKRRAELTVADVLRTPEGEERDEMIRRWAREVWELWSERHAEVEALFQSRVLSRGL